MRSLLFFSTLVAVALGASAGHNKLEKELRAGYKLRARATATGLTSPDKPQQTGTVSNCNLWYDVGATDTCDTIPAAFGITRAQFLAWNPAVSADCTQNFWTGYAYCVGVSSSSESTPASILASPTPLSTFLGIPCTCAPTSTTKAGTPSSSSSSSHATTAGPKPTTPTFPNIACNCNKFYDTGPDDTCPSVQTRFGITADQFFQWNPDVSKNCTFNFYVGFSYCVGIDASGACSTVSSQPAQTGATETLSYSAITDGTFATQGPRPTSTDWPPKPVQEGIPSNCLQYYQANAADTCVSIQHRFSHQMTMDQLLEWNPAIRSDCLSVFVNYYYCVSVPTAYTGLPDATTQYTITQDPSPTTSWNLSSLSALQTAFTGAATPCAILFPAPQNSSCDDLDSMIGVPAASLSAWNTGINCASLNAGEWYCIASTTLDSGSPITTQPTDNSTMTGTLSGSATLSSGALSGSTTSTSRGSSSSPTSTTGVTSKSSSTALLSTTTKATSAATSSPVSLATPSPTQTGMVANCNRFYKVETGDSCWALASAAGIDLDKLYAMNPAVGTDCSHLLSGYYICLGLASDGVPATTITSGTPVAPIATTSGAAAVTSSVVKTTTSGSATVVATPSPVQTGMVSGCTSFYFVKAGDACSVIASNAGISLSTFISLNPAVGSDCRTLLAGYYVCIGS